MAELGNRTPLEYADHISLGDPANPTRAFQTMRLLNGSGAPMAEEYHYAYDSAGKLRVIIEKCTILLCLVNVELIRRVSERWVWARRGPDYEVRFGGRGRFVPEVGSINGK